MNRIYALVAAMMLAATSVLISCASNPPAWYKAGYSKFETENALAQCEYDVSMQKLPDDKQVRAVNNCMIRQGFRFVDNPPDDPEIDHYVPPARQSAPPQSDSQQNDPQQTASQPTQQQQTSKTSRNDFVDESGDKQWWK